jgi:hypothetical protein
MRAFLALVLLTLLAAPMFALAEDSHSMLRSEGVASAAEAEAVNDRELMMKKRRKKGKKPMGI